MSSQHTSTQHTQQFFSLYREYTTYSLLNLSPSSNSLTISDICVLMAIQSYCILSSPDKNSPLKGSCTKPTAFFSKLFNLSERSVKRSLSHLEELSIISREETSGPKTRKISLLKDFSISTTPITDQNPNEEEEYHDKSTFIKIYPCTFDPKTLNGRDLSTTDILVYNIIYSYAMNNPHNSTHECKQSYDSLSIWLPISKATIKNSIQKLKYYDLITINEVGTNQHKLSTLTIKDDIVNHPAEQFILW